MWSSGNVAWVKQINDQLDVGVDKIRKVGSYKSKGNNEW